MGWMIPHLLALEDGGTPHTVVGFVAVIVVAVVCFAVVVCKA